MLKIKILTIFPEAFTSYFRTSIIKRAQEKKLVKIEVYNLRDWAKDRHKTVDDKPYGGGPGMILKADIIYQAIKKIKSRSKKKKVVLLTPAGKIFNQKIASRFSKLDEIILICGHYEGTDARVEKFVDEEISLGPYILTGGEIPAMIITDAVTRLIKGAIKPESLEEESELSAFAKGYGGSTEGGKIINEYPQYTRPRVFTIKNRFGKIKKLEVPKVLLSGNHAKIKEWRRKHQ